MRHFIVGTAGHVDHGKSALVKALSGTDPDRLPEEKARGVTIDLGFAELVLQGPSGENLHAGLVDVPGHEDFVKNMIAGVGSLDLALFVVAADDGWMPQTEEHLQILSYLGVERAVVVLTKSDLAETAQIAADVREHLRRTPFEQAPIVETSVVTLRGVEELKQIIARELSSLPPKPDLGKPRLLVDRAFSLHGVGTVVTGTLTGGSLARDQHVVVQPGNIPARIRMIQSHNREADEVGPGKRVALNLPDLAASRKNRGVFRGDVITVADIGEPISVFDAALIKLAREATNARPVKNGASVYLHHGTTRVAARIALVHEANDDVDLAQVTLESPVLAMIGDRFVLRDPSERRTLAGGIILDIATNRKKFHTANQREFLAARARSPHDSVVAVSSELRRDGAKERIDILKGSNFTPDQVAQAIAHLVAANELVAHGDIVADSNWWDALRRHAIAAIEKEHEEHPELDGVDLADLRADIKNLGPGIFDRLIIDLGRDGYRREGNVVKRSEHRATLPPQLAATARKIRELIATKPFDPPARKQIAIDSQSRQVLNFLIQEGELIELGPDLVLSREVFTEMKNKIRMFMKDRPARVSDLRQALGSSRRIMVPLLERLDRERVTRRDGDRRILLDRTVASANPALD